MSAVPEAYCDDCGLSRDPREHHRAEDKVNAAKDWLYRYCPNRSNDDSSARTSPNARNCAIKYRAGVILPIPPPPPPEPKA